MRKFAVLFPAVALFSGLCFAQADAPQQQPQPGTTQTTVTQQSTTTTTSGSSQTVAPTEIRRWKGTLVDMSCMSGGSTGAAAASSTTTTTSETTTTTTDQATTSTTTTSTETEEKAKEHRTRMSESGQNQAQCPASNSTTMFGLKLEDGSVLRFDSVGNTRAAEQLKDKKSWVKDLGEGKAIRAKVNGITSGDKVIVTSIH